MTAKVIHHIRFSLYNGKECLEGLGNLENQGISL